MVITDNGRGFGAADLDRQPLEFPAENVGDAGDRLVQNGAVHGPPLHPTGSRLMFRN